MLRKGPLIASVAATLAIAAVGWLAAHRIEKRNSAVEPAPHAGAESMHEKFLEIAHRARANLLLLGDSITDGWGGEGHSPKCLGTRIYTKEFGSLHAANFGIGGDRTEHVLWRLEHGELDGIRPKVVMLMIGTNNDRVNTPSEIAAGVATIVREIRKRSPETRVLLLGIFPCGEKPNPRRERIKDVNRIIAGFDDAGSSVRYLDIGDRFLNRDGAMSRDIMPDYLHPSEKGYRIWADAVRGPLREMLAK